MAKQDDPESEKWYFNKWRPMMGWMYALICLFDFVIAPVFFTFFNGQFVPWEPNTLKSSGMFHTAMGVILGVYVYQRSEEKKMAINVSTQVSATTEPETTSETPKT